MLYDSIYLGGYGFFVWPAFIFALVPSTSIFGANSLSSVILLLYCLICVFAFPFLLTSILFVVVLSHSLYTSCARSCTRVQSGFCLFPDPDACNYLSAFLPL